MILIHPTIQYLKQSLHQQVEQMAIFGSASYKDLNEVNDIDILLFVDPCRFSSIRGYVCSLNLTSTAHVEKIMCNYTKLPETNKPQGDRSEKPIHFAFLPNNEAEFAQTSLWRKNENSIQFIW